MPGRIAAGTPGPGTADTADQRGAAAEPRAAGGSSPASCQGRGHDDSPEPTALAAGAERGVHQPSSSPLGASDRDTQSADRSPGNHDWLRLHASELLDRLQSWASDLDAREAQLNARLSVQDHRERRFRLIQQDIAAELAEQRRSIERLREENLAQARRLAFQTDSTG